MPQYNEIIKLGANGEDWGDDPNTSRAIHFQSKGANQVHPNMAHTGGRIYSTSTAPGWPNQALILEAGKEWETIPEPWFLNQLVLKGDGNVGIGTTAPSARLDVNGSMKASGDLDVAGVVRAGGVALDASAIAAQVTADIEAQIAQVKADIEVLIPNAVDIVNQVLHDVWATMETSIPFFPQGQNPFVV